MKLLKALLARTTRHAGYKLLSLGVALIAWVYVQEAEIDEMQLRAEIDWVFAPDLVPTDELPHGVLFTAQGSRSTLRRARDVDLRLRIDLAEVRESRQHVEFPSFSVEGLPQGLRVLRFSPSSVDFAVDQVEERKVMIVALQVGDPAEGYALEVRMEPEVVELRGPKVSLGGLREVRTKPLDVSELQQDAKVQALLDLPRGVSVVGDVSVVAHVHVEPLVSRQVFSEVPIQVWGGAPYEVDAVKVAVTLEGPTRALDGVGAEDVVAFVVLPDTPDQPSYEAEFGPTDGVRIRVLHSGGALAHVVKVQPRKVTVTHR